ncbi:MAG: hypothetical protein HY270_21850 [Deltaproteobacteria bacterium]|nr:hypothetical protein [Deltaproteobacteria bacterium]
MARANQWHRAQTLLLFVVVLAFAACDRSAPASPVAMRAQYLIDLDSFREPSLPSQTLVHVALLNPTDTVADVAATVYFEEQAPAHFSLRVPAASNQVSSPDGWPIPPNVRWALKVESLTPIVAQATLGWSNVGNDYAPSAHTTSPRGRREAAKSYMAIPQLSRAWRIADGFLIDDPKQIWLRESERVVILNPGNSDAHAVLTLYDVGRREPHPVHIAAQRLKVIDMTSVAGRNRRYGAEVSSDQPIAVQWLREVRWYDSEEMMTFWSLPAVPETADGWR